MSNSYFSLIQFVESQNCLIYPQRKTQQLQIHEKFCLNQKKHRNFIFIQYVSKPSSHYCQICKYTFPDYLQVHFM